MQVADKEAVFPSDLAAPIIGDGKFAKEVLPLQRVGDPEEMAGVILFLTSRAGGYCNGNIVLIDGGRIAMAPSSY